MLFYEGIETEFLIVESSTHILKFFRERGVLMKENKFQANLIKELKRRFKGCIVTKLDSGHIQGIPDLLVLYRRHWATLECKKSAVSSVRPNQKYYVDLMDSMSFSRFIYPENMEVVLNELQRSFEA